MLSVCFRCDQSAPGNSLSATILKKGGGGAQEEIGNVRWSLFTCSLLKTSLNNLNLNKVTVERDRPNQFLAFYFLPPRLLQRLSFHNGFTIGNGIEGRGLSFTWWQDLFYRSWMLEELSPVFFLFLKNTRLAWGCQSV